MIINNEFDQEYFGLLCEDCLKNQMLKGRILTDQWIRLSTVGDPKQFNLKCLVPKVVTWQ